MDLLELLLFGSIAIPCAVLAVKYWQHALFGVFILLVFEGALRKWVFPSAQAQIYLLKDAILLAVYLGFILEQRKGLAAGSEMTFVKVVLFLGFLFGCFEVFNPNSPSILVGLIGLKTYFLYAPIAFVMPYAITSRDQFLSLMRRYLIMAIPVAILGFVQVAAGPASSLNTYVSRSEDAPAVLAYFGREEFIVRTSGTFSYISGYTAFLTFIAFLGLGYNMARHWRIKNNVLPISALTLAVGAMFTTGSRSPVYTLILAGPIILLLAMAGRMISARIALRLVILLPCIAFVALNISSKAFEAFVDRAIDSESLADRIEMTSEFIGAVSNAPIFGMGIGTTHPSALAIMGTHWPWWLGDLLTESEWARIAVETGLIGLFLIAVARTAIALISLRWAVSFKDPTFRAFGIVLAIHLLTGVMGSIMLNPTAGLYYWGSIGLIITMRRLERTARARSEVFLASLRASLGAPAVCAKP